jgi:hypothetical protein
LQAILLHIAVVLQSLEVYAEDEHNPLLPLVLLYASSSTFKESKRFEWSKAVPTSVLWSGLFSL